MAFNDEQELNRVREVLMECSPKQLLTLLRSAGIGTNKVSDFIYEIDFSGDDEANYGDENFEDPDDPDYD